MATTHGCCLDVADTIYINLPNFIRTRLRDGPFGFRDLDREYICLAGPIDGSRQFIPSLCQAYAGHSASQFIVVSPAEGTCSSLQADTTEYGYCIETRQHEPGC